MQSIGFANPRRITRESEPALFFCITLDFAKAGKNLFITGPSGTGKSFLACALGHEVCKKGIRTLYANAFKLLKGCQGQKQS